MTNEQILNEVASIFRQVFDNESLAIQLETNQDDIEEWDSLEHINLLSLIEQKFQIKFDLNDVLHTKSIREIVSLIEQKVK